MLDPGGTSSRGEAVRTWQGVRLRPTLWLLLAGIIAIGIVIGLFGASITVILLSSFGAQAADPADVSALSHQPAPSASSACPQFIEITQVCEAGHEDIHQGGRYDEF
jgi:hypothetical protein